MDAKYESIDFAHLDRMRKWHIIFPVFLVSVIAFLDRVNIAYAGMTMTQQLADTGSIRCRFRDVLPRIFLL